MILQVGVKVFLNDTKGRYLFLKRAHPYPGDTECKWDIPGGRINVDEPLVEALQREVKEETQLILQKELDLIFAQDIFQGEKHVVRLTYQGKATGQILLDFKEHQSYQWIELSQADSLYKDIYLDPVITLLSRKAVS
ncbi:MAG TPA: NUDIX hydrolase [Patescibacteria group bacterium]|nr:NUDIX hydrolase [Patescibacteria group bacterium]